MRDESLSLSYRYPNKIFVANAQVSGDAMMCRWGVAAEPTIGDKRLN